MLFRSIEALCARPDLEGVEVCHLHTAGPAPFTVPGVEKRVRSVSFFAAGPVREAIAAANAIPGAVLLAAGDYSITRPASDNTNSEGDFDLLAGMVALDPNKRISARMAMLHPYFDDLDKTNLPASRL